MNEQLELHARSKLNLVRTLNATLQCDGWCHYSLSTNGSAIQLELRENMLLNGVHDGKESHEVLLKT